MKKNPTHEFEKRTGKHPVIGTLADESSLRLQKWLANGCNAFDNNRPVSQPLSFWREQDILEYILTHELDFAEVYGDVVYDGESYYTTGVDRTGCMFCGFGCHLEKSPNRFEKMKKTHPSQYEYCLRTTEGGGARTTGSIRLYWSEILTYLKNPPFRDYVQYQRKGGFFYGVYKKPTELHRGKV